MYLFLTLFNLIYCMKFVPKLSDLSKSWLEIIKTSSSESNRTKNRAEAILLSSEGFPIKDLMKICGATHKTISGWIDAWKINDFDALLDAPHPGRPVKIMPSQEEEVIEMVKKNPRQLNATLEEINQKLDLSISKKTLKRLLKKKTSHGNVLGNL